MAWYEQWTENSKRHTSQQHCTDEWRLKLYWKKENLLGACSVEKDKMLREKKTKNPVNYGLIPFVQMYHGLFWETVFKRIPKYELIDFRLIPSDFKNEWNGLPINKDGWIRFYWWPVRDIGHIESYFSQFSPLKIIVNSQNRPNFYRIFKRAHNFYRNSLGYRFTPKRISLK